MARRDGVGINLAAIGLLCVAMACIRIGGTQERRLVDLNDGPAALRLRVAQDYATPSQLDRLRATAKTQFLNLSDRDLATLGLAWQRASFADGEHVMLEVTFMPEGSGVDAKGVADYVAAQVLKDVGPKLKGDSGSAS